MHEYSIVQALLEQCEQSEVRYYLCAHCQSTDVSVVDGEDMYLMTLEMESLDFTVTP